MKHLLAIAFCAAFTLGFSSCNENAVCYECTHPNNCDVDICDGQATPDNDGICVLAPNQSGSTNLEYKNAYEADGYTCRVR
jgi:hypothetical protein